jgi:hypothetical protein
MGAADDMKDGRREAAILLWTAIELPSGSPHI